jgi:hypothetical protein
MFKYIFFIVSLLIVNPAFVHAEDNKANTDVKVADNQEVPEDTWFYKDQNGDLKIRLYFFWSRTCPHCRKAYPFITNTITEKYDWVDLKSHMVSNNQSRQEWKRIASYVDKEAKFVPFMAICGKAISGYGTDASTGKYIEKTLKACYVAHGGKLEDAKVSQEEKQEIIRTANDYKPKQILDLTPQKKTETEQTVAKTSDCDDKEVCEEDIKVISIEDLGKENPPVKTKSDAVETEVEEVQPVDIPFVGVVNPEKLSLPLLTVVLAGVDAFNPCAFFVLLFLLSIMVNAKSRSRMLIVGGIFVFFSGLIYFLFMTAWLNVFELLGGGDGGIIIKAAGCLALVAALINIKEFAMGKGDVSLSMSTENRSGLIKRMGKLSSASSMATMIFGTTVLAILANAYELLCTAGFPMIYTSVLTMHNLPVFTRYMYLVAYNVVYIVPLALIVLAFTMTLGKRKLTEKEGQTLKLMSGIMMLGLGGTLVVNPTVLQSASYAIGLIIGAILMTFVVVFIKKKLVKL